LAENWGFKLVNLKIIINERTMKLWKGLLAQLVFIGFTLFLVFSLYSYSPLDPGIGVSLGTGEKVEVKNLGGLLGAYLASLFYFLFGTTSLLIPPFLFLSFLLYLMGVKPKKLFLLFSILLFTFILSLSWLFDLLKVKNELLWGKFPLQGGLIGETALLLIEILGLPGFLLLILLLLGLAMIIAFEGFQALKKRLFKSKDVQSIKESIEEKGGNRRDLGEVLSTNDEADEEIIKTIIKTERDEKAFSEDLKEDFRKDKTFGIKEEAQKKKDKKEELRLPPPLELLSDPPLTSYRIRPEELKERALLLKAKLREFGIDGEVTAINPGPVITVFEFKPAPGIKLSRILSLVDDLALGLSAKSVRIVAPIPGKNVIGIEISNPQREWVYLKDIIKDEAFKRSDSPLTMALGKDISGKPVVADLRKMPHLLIAGSTGSGKSIFLHSVIISIIYKSKPQEVRFLMIDPKRIELSVYDGIPYLLHPVVLEPKMATRALRWAVSEMERRYALFEELSVRNLESYNEEFEEKLPYIVIIIDELADLMVVSSKEVETLLTRLAQMARAAGIHLIVATQRPSVDVITGLIKVNFPARISFQVTSKVDSRTILDTQGAERLLGAGDMLFMPPGSSHLQRIHAPYVSEKEIKRVVEYLKAFGEPEYLADLSALEEEEKKFEESAFDSEDDELYREALRIAYQYGKISVSMLQRKLRIGYNRAARLVEKMEEEGILGPSDGVRPRPVIKPPKSL